jgi:thiol-disulfide isomerase/thioredoxin
LRPICRIAFLASVVSLTFGRSSSIAGGAASAGASGAIVVRVVDAMGTSRSDVAINLLHYNSDWRYWQRADRDIRTDERGIAEYNGLSSNNSYVVRATTNDGLVGYRAFLFSGDELRHEVDLKIERPVATSIRARDDDGNPVAGARIWSLEHTGSNGSTTLNWQSLQACDLAIETSSRDGELKLPALPPGTVDLTLIHREFAPTEVNGVEIGKPAAADATFSRGVKLTFRMRMDGNETSVDSILLDLRYSPFDHPSTLIGRLTELSNDGVATLTVAAGKYHWLRLRHPEYVVTPIYSEQYGRTLADKSEPFELRPGQDTFTFHLKRKVKVGGLVVDETTGQPAAGEDIEAQMSTGKVEGPFARFADEWTHVGWGETDENGEYEVELAEGRARITFSSQGKIGKPEYHELQVTSQGANSAPDFVVGFMPKVRGVVHDANGQPLPQVVVRFRGSILAYAVEPAITDDAGRFELAPPWIPEDLQSHDRLPAQSLVAFHPAEPLYAHRVVELDRPETLSDVVLQMAPQNFDSLIARFPADLNAWQRGEIPAEDKARLSSISLFGKPAPELDAAHWLNTNNSVRSLADFRGKYVLLQFWTTWCGPCHADMPGVKLLDKLYRDKGLVVIGVHDNSMPLSAIEADVAKEMLEYPIAVDHPDGRIMKRYKEHGISGFPSYLLIGPDGTVIKDDRTVAGPTLRSFKIEIVRELFMPKHSQPADETAKVER